MEFSSAIYGAIAFFLLLYSYLLRSKSLKPKHKLPPEAGGARPILGHLHLMGGSGSAAQPPHINLAAMADQHGPIFTIRMGVRRAVVVSSWKIANELFTTHDVAVSSRPKVRANIHMSYNFAMPGFSPYGRYWREMRKLMTVELLSTRRIQLLSHVCVSEIAQSVKEIYMLWQEKRDESGRVLVDLKKWFADLNLNVILRMVVGKRFGSSSGDVREEMRRCQEVIRDFFQLTGQFVPADALPWLEWLDLGGYEKRMKKTAKELDGFVQQWLEEHGRKRDSGGDMSQDFMGVMMLARQGLDQFEAQYDADTIIKSTCLSMILGGADSTTVMLTWALTLLLNNPHVLTKAQEELDKHVGRKSQVKESDIHNLVYLHAIIKETLRLCPAGPLGAPRVFDQDCTIGEYHIPKGTCLIVNMWKLQRDPEVWSDDVLEFKPERFLTTHTTVDVKGRDFELIPFGAGRRNCSGMNLALHMLHLVLANLLQAFNVTTVCNEAVDTTNSVGGTNVEPTSLDVLIAPRLSSGFY